MSTRTLVTFEQFAQFHDDGMKHELLQGEHIVVPPAKSRHTRIQQKLQDVLRPYVRSIGSVKYTSRRDSSYPRILGCNQMLAFLDPCRFKAVIPMDTTKGRLPSPLRSLPTQIPLRNWT
jgi:hypothetical protein